MSAGGPVNAYRTITASLPDSVGVLTHRQKPRGQSAPPRFCHIRIREETRNTLPGDPVYFAQLSPVAFQITYTG